MNDATYRVVDLDEQMGGLDYEFIATIIAPSGIVQLACDRAVSAVTEDGEPTGEVVFMRRDVEIATMSSGFEYLIIRRAIHEKVSVGDMAEEQLERLLQAKLYQARADAITGRKSTAENAGD